MLRPREQRRGLRQQTGVGHLLPQPRRRALFATVGDRPPLQKAPPATPLAPLEVRHAVYEQLIKLSPAASRPAELIEGEHGLISRGFTGEDFYRFGALPAKAADRAALARELRVFVRAAFPEYAERTGYAGVIGVPGFWQEPTGAVQL